MSSRLKTFLTGALFLSAFLYTSGQQEQIPDFSWESSTFMNAGNGSFAPYYISALQHGKISSSKGWILDALIHHDFDCNARFSWEAGLELCGGITSSVSYKKWDEGTAYTHRLSPPNIWLQQFYAGIKYRSLFIEAGMKQKESALLDNSLTSGDIVESGNARPIPQIRAGFIDFRDIPFTNGWVQIQGELAYGKFVDNSWLEKFYGRATSHINTGAYYIYRRLYFRSKPTENLSVTFGMQAAGEIGGKTQWWYRGWMIDERKFKSTFVDLLKMIIPTQVGTAPGEYYDGNNLGSWDFLLSYRIPGTTRQIKAYLQKPWEKGSSIGWRNGWDGLWGIEYETHDDNSPLNAILIEYLYTMNQSGPIHYAPHDSPGATITTDVSGGDQYYNNNDYNAYANYGMGIGTPFLKAPIFNIDGYPQYTDNRIRGIHMAAKGKIAGSWSWKAAVSYREAFGDGRLPRTKKLDDFSWLIESYGHIPHTQGVLYKIQVAMDHGNLLGNNFGVSVSAIYKGDLNFKRK